MYSQNEEERYILDHFQGRETGVFLDIGANDGITLSNTRALAEKGWQGYYVEPDNRAFAKLQENTKGMVATLFHVGIGAEEKEVVLYSNHAHLKDSDRGLLSTFVPNEVKRWGKKEKWQQQQARLIPFSALDLPEKIDMISIDVEGMDWEVLAQIPLIDLGVSCLVVEYNAQPVRRNVFLNHLLPLGFRLVYSSFENLVFVK